MADNCVPDGSSTLSASTQISYPRRKVMCFYQNVRGLCTKLRTLRESFYDSLFDIVFLTETWLNPSVGNAEIASFGYNIFRVDRKFEAMGKTRGGGVLLAVKSDISVEELSIPQEFFSELPSCDLLIAKTSNQIFFLMYIPPATLISEYQAISEIVQAVCFNHPSHSPIIIGDFNIPEFSDKPNNPKCQILNNLSASLNIIQLNTITNHNDHILDLIFSVDRFSVHRCSTEFVAVDLHHPSLEFEVIVPKRALSSSIYHTPNFFKRKYNFRKCNFPLLYQSLVDTDWSFMEEILDVNLALHKFYCKLYSLFDAAIPPFQAASFSKYPPWFTFQIISNIKKKTRLLNKFRKSGDINILKNFKQTRRLVKQAINIAYEQHISKIESDIKNDPKSFWSHISSLRSNESIPTCMETSNEMVIKKENIADAFADHFEKSFRKSNTKSMNIQLTAPTDICHVSSFTLEQTLAAIKTLKPKRSAGPDEVPAFLVRDGATVFSYPLQILFNLILTTGVFPDQWKIASITPIHKSGSKSKIENYRPISKISNFAKIFEIVLSNIIKSFLATKISIFQHGFVHGRSTITNLFSIVQFLAENLDHKKQVDVIYLDLKKAFDSLDHSILIKKLDAYGLAENILTVIRSYLCNRKQFVCCHGSHSRCFNVLSGVPQGSILGPLLFNIFINDITTNLKCKHLLYADDLKIFSTIQRPEDSLQLNDDLLSIAKWCDINDLLINCDKSVMMTFFARQTKIIESIYSINGIPLRRVTSHRDLGVYFDEHLSYKDHISKTISQAFRQLGFVFRNSYEFKSSETTITLYKSFVRSKLEYAFVLWWPYSQELKSEIEKVQRRFLKFLYFRQAGVYPCRGYPQERLLQQFGLTEIRDRFDAACMTFLFKSFVSNEIDCVSLIESIRLRVPRLNTRHMSTFALPTARTNILLRSPLYRMMENWNKYDNVLDIFNCSVSDIKRLK